MRYQKLPLRPCYYMPLMRNFLEKTRRKLTVLPRLTGPESHRCKCGWGTLHRWVLGSQVWDPAKVRARGN